jgi:hypothetical protein
MDAKQLPPADPEAECVNAANSSWSTIIAGQTEADHAAYPGVGQEHARADVVSE